MKKGILLGLGLMFLMFGAADAFGAQCKPGEKPKGHAVPGTIVYGYWCGTGFKGLDSCWKDDLDKLCRSHDMCERANIKRGKKAHSCECDLTFISEAQRHGGMGRTMAFFLRQRNTSECLRGQ